MDNQQVSIYNEEEVFIQHPVYTKLSVSNMGNVICSKTGRTRYTKLNKQGYVGLLYQEQNKIKMLKVHRLVAELHLPPPSAELVEACSKTHHGKVLVRHLDNDKTNNKHTNLEWCDIKTNNNQAVTDGLVPPLKGELNGRAILTEGLVHVICKFYEDGGTPKQAQEKFSISVSQSTKIKAGIQWKHIWCLYNIKVNRRR